jgi:hypothetical protein
MFVKLFIYKRSLSTSKSWGICKQMNVFKLSYKQFNNSSIKQIVLCYKFTLGVRRKVRNKKLNLWSLSNMIYFQSTNLCLSGNLTTEMWCEFCTTSGNPSFIKDFICPKNVKRGITQPLDSNFAIMYSVMHVTVQTPKYWV